MENLRTHQQFVLKSNPLESCQQINPPGSASDAWGFLTSKEAAFTRQKHRPSYRMQGPVDPLSPYE